MYNTPSAATTPSTVHCASGICLCKTWSLLCQWQRARFTVRHEARLLSWRRECCCSRAELCQCVIVGGDDWLSLLMQAGSGKSTSEEL